VPAARVFAFFTVLDNHFKLRCDEGGDDKITFLNWQLSPRHLLGYCFCKQYSMSFLLPHLIKFNQNNLIMGALAIGLLRL
jgi:hypothetical protein